MWVLLQFISGSIQKNALADFLPVMKLFDLLYPEKEVQMWQGMIQVYCAHFQSLYFFCLLSGFKCFYSSCFYWQYYSSSGRIRNSRSGNVRDRNLFYMQQLYFQHHQDLSVFSLPLQCIPVPDINKPQSTHSFAMTCIWIHLNRKAQNDNSKLQIPIPHSLKLHHECVSSKYCTLKYIHQVNKYLKNCALPHMHASEQLYTKNTLIVKLNPSKRTSLCFSPSCLLGFSSSRCVTRLWACLTTRSPCCVTPTAPTLSASLCRWASWQRPSMETDL